MEGSVYKLLLVTSRWDAMHTTVADFPSLNDAEAAFKAVKEQSSALHQVTVRPVRLYDLEAEQSKGAYIPGEF
jgi:hypothetical protein